MATITESIDITAPPETVRALVGDRASISDWHPAVATAEVTDSVPSCSLVGGGDLVEPILEHSDLERFYVCGLTEGPLPVSSFSSRASVEATEGESRLVWSAAFEPNDPTAGSELNQMISGLHSAGLGAVRDRLVPRATRPVARSSRHRPRPLPASPIHAALRDNRESQ